MNEENMPRRVQIERRIDSAAMKAAEWYEQNTVLRGAVAVLPFIGGGVDVILASEAQRAAKERIHKMLEDMHGRMKVHEAEAINQEYLESDEFIDLVMKAFESATKTRDEEKIRLYARILTEATVRDKQGKYFPEEYLNVLTSLTPKQVEVARVMYDVQGEPRNSVHPEGSEGWNEEREEVSKKVGLDMWQLIFMLKGLVAAGLVIEIGRTTPGMIAVEYSVTPAFKEMMEFLESSR